MSPLNPRVLKCLNALRDVVLSVFLILLAMIFEGFTAIAMDRGLSDQWSKDHSKMIVLVEKPFDLWLVGLTVLLGASVGSAAEKRKKTSEVAATSADAAPKDRESATLPIILATVGTLFIIMGCMMFPTLISDHWQRIFIPDLTAVGYIGFNVFRVSR